MAISYSSKVVLGAILMSNYLCQSGYFFEITNQQSTYFLIAGVSLFVSAIIYRKSKRFGSFLIALYGGVYFYNYGLDMLSIIPKQSSAAVVFMLVVAIMAPPLFCFLKAVSLWRTHDKGPVCNAERQKWNHSPIECYRCEEVSEEGKDFVFNVVHVNTKQEHHATQTRYSSYGKTKSGYFCKKCLHKIYLEKRVIARSTFIASFIIAPVIIVLSTLFEPAMAVGIGLFIGCSFILVSLYKYFERENDNHHIAYAGELIQKTEMDNSQGVMLVTPERHRELFKNQ